MELIIHENQSREIYYCPEVERIKEVNHWIEQFRKIWIPRFDQLEKLSPYIRLTFFILVMIILILAT